MSYKFVKVNMFYPSYLADYYARNPWITKESYAEQLSHLMSDRFGWSDFLTKQLCKLGVNAQEIVANAIPLQNAWALEHGSRANGNHLLVQQLKSLKPDVVLWDSTSVHNGEFINYVKAEVRTIRQSIGYCGGPFSQERIKQFKSFDYMLSCAPGFVSTFKKQGIPSYQLNYAFEDSCLNEIRGDNLYPVSDVFFAGGLTVGSGYHNLRIEVIKKLLEDNVNIRIHAPLLQEGAFRLLVKQGLFLSTFALKYLGFKKLLNRIPGLRKAVQWQECPKKNKYPKLVEQKILNPLYGIEMLKALNRAKIGFNVHIDAAGDDAGNMRLFETTGVGTCLVTDWKESLKNLFEPEKEVVTYRSSAECIEKIKWLLDNPLEREGIAKAGQNRTLRDHTYEKRAVELDEIVRRMMD